MSVSTEGLAVRLHSYRVLRDALGAKWIRDQDGIDPIDSSFPLARWLRRSGFESDLATLDAVFTDLANVPGIAVGASACAAMLRVCGRR